MQYYPLAMKYQTRIKDERSLSEKKKYSSLTASEIPVTSLGERNKICLVLFNVSKTHVF